MFKNYPINNKVFNEFYRVNIFPEAELSMYEKNKLLINYAVINVDLPTSLENMYVSNYKKLLIERLSLEIGDNIIFNYSDKELQILNKKYNTNNEIDTANRSFFNYFVNLKDVFLKLNSFFGLAPGNLAVENIYLNIKFAPLTNLLTDSSIENLNLISAENASVVVSYDLYKYVPQIMLSQKISVWRGQTITTQTDSDGYINLNLAFTRNKETIKKLPITEMIFKIDCLTESINSINIQYFTLRNDTTEIINQSVSKAINFIYKTQNPEINLQNNLYGCYLSTNQTEITNSEAVYNLFLKIKTSLISVENIYFVLLFKIDSVFRYYKSDFVIKSDFSFGINQV